MTWNKTRTLGVAALIALLLVGGAAFWSIQHFRPATTGPTIATFEPMAGEWEGEFVMRGEPATPAEPMLAKLLVTTDGQGRRCQIEMRVRRAPQAREQVFRFTHEIRADGHQLFSTHDARIS